MTDILQATKDTQITKEKIIEIGSLQKSFGNVRALQGLDFNLYKGDIVGLLGDNGAGKSTLVKILSGFYRPDQGYFNFNGQKVNFKKYTVATAREMGIETVYQDKALGDQQPLWRNLFMGRHLKNRWGLIDIKKEREAATQLIQDLGFSGAGIFPDTPAGVLSGGERQGLALGRAMYFQAKVVILDEPTTALAISEVDLVLDFIKKVRERGGSVIFITHSMDHVWQVANRFVVMAHGRVFGQWNREQLTLESLFNHLRAALR